MVVAELAGFIKEPSFLVRISVCRFTGPSSRSRPQGLYSKWQWIEDPSKKRVPCLQNYWRFCLIENGGRLRLMLAWSFLVTISRLPAVPDWSVCRASLSCEWPKESKPARWDWSGQTSWGEHGGVLVACGFATHCLQNAAQRPCFWIALTWLPMFLYCAELDWYKETACSLHQDPRMSLSSYNSTSGHWMTQLDNFIYFRS